MFKALLILLLCFCAPAAASPDAGEAETVYLAAKASMAVYSDKDGAMFASFFNDRQWQVRRGMADKNRRGFFLAERGDGLCVLALAGTQSLRDVKTDLKIKPVPFPGYAKAMIHAGFLAYAEEMARQEGANLYDLLINKPNTRLLLTGHSLGGAAAVALAAFLAARGVAPERLEVITFGAPAVGNKAFADYCAGKFSLLRVYNSLDPVPGALQNFSAYAQFGRGLPLKGDPRFKLVQHTMAVYADFAGRNFYDRRRLAPEEIPGDIALDIIKGGNRYALTDYEYMLASLEDIYRMELPGIRLPRDKEGARYVARARLDVGQVRGARERWLVSLEIRLLSFDGETLAAGSFNRQMPFDASLLSAAAHVAFQSVSYLKETEADKGRALVS